MAKKAVQKKKPSRRRHRGQTLIQRSRRISAAEKAAFHQVAGAGKRHVRRKFLALTDDDEAAIVDRIEQHLRSVLEG